MAFFLAVLAILPALYAVLPRPKQLDLGLRLNWFDRLLFLLTTLLLLGFELHDFLVVRYRAFNHRLPSGITPTNLSEIAVLLLALILWLRIRFARLTRSRIGEFSVLAQELLWSGAGAELVALIENHSHALFRMIRGEPLLDRLIRRLDSAHRSFLFPQWEDFLGQLSDKPAPRKQHDFAEKFLLRVALLSPLLKRLFRWDDYQEQLEQITRSVLLNDSFIAATVKFRPYLGICIIREWRNSRDVFDFQTIYVESLLATKDSVFYRELRDNQNMDGDRYEISSTNKLLRFFLSDANVAYKRAIYKPIGDYVLRRLDDLHFSPKKDPYNRALMDFAEEARKGDLIYGAKQFFAIMVLEALHQDVDWHMWLYYLSHIVERMCRNSRVLDPLSRPDEEFPNRYSYLIYETVTALRDFVTAAREINSPNLVMKYGPGEHENGNIAKSSIFALSGCMKSVLLSPHLGDRFQNYIGENHFEALL